ncbi:MAG TPA: porin [Gammaproteobacteria bacterium]|nr:porin [Gammaproteobacteria bacterium]
MNRRLASTVAALLLYAGNAPALENIQLNGFFTVGAAVSNEDVDTQNGNISDDIGFDEDTRIGVQVSADINDRMSVTAQLLGASDRRQTFDADFDWGYVTYEINDNVDLRGGKIKFPTFLISDYIEVGYAYPWIRPPAEVYASNPITAITGADLLLRARAGSAELLLQPFFGTATNEEALVPQEALPALSLPAGTVAYANFDVRNLAGVNAAISGPLGSFHATYLETSVSAPDFGITSKEDVVFWSAGGNLEWNNIIGYSEYFERDIDGLANVFFPNQKGWYATLGYRFGKLMPHFTYGKLEDNSSSSDVSRGVEQESYTLGLRYELAASAALKLEAQRVEPDKNDRGLMIAPVDDVNIYSLAVDVIF